MTMGDRIAVMSAGVLQQAGTPRELYDHPRNVFVAGFIGSPAMNFLTAQTDGSGLQIGDLSMQLGGQPGRIAMDRPKGSAVVLGFRPEHLDIVDGQGDVVTIPVEVDVVEYLGNEELIHAKSANSEIVAIVPSARQLKAGDRVSLGVALDKLHMFDAESEETLLS
jgi:ABC-type sugar transport system ATPase subunit